MDGIKGCDKVEGSGLDGSIELAEIGFHKLDVFETSSCRFLCACTIASCERSIPTSEIRIPPDL